MKKILIITFVCLACMTGKGQTIQEIARVLNTGPKAIASQSASALNADLLPALDLLNSGFKIISVQINGTWSGTVSFFGSSDNFATSAIPIAVYKPDMPGDWIISTTANGMYNIPTLGFRYIRIRMTSYNSGTASAIVHGFMNNIAIPFSASITLPGSMAVTGPLTDAQLRNSAVPVSGSFFQANQPVTIQSNATVNASQTGSWDVRNVTGSLPLPSGASTSAKQPALGTAGVPSIDVLSIQGIASMTAIKVDGTATVQPISASSLPLPTGATTETTLSSLNGKFNSLGQKAMTGSIPVSIASDQSAISVSGSLTANIGTTNGLALDATLTNRSQFVKITDGTNDASVKAASTAAIATDKALVVAVSPNNSVAVTGSVTANAGTNLNTSLLATESSLSGLNGKFGSLGQKTMAGSTPVVIASDQSAVTISGTVTSNAGTNLNTSALALESGGNLATIKTNTDNLALAIASTTSGQKGNLIQGAVTTGAPTYVTGQTNPISLTTAGSIRTDIGTNGTVAINAAIPTGSNVIGKVSIDQGTPGTTNKVDIGTNGTVAINTALPSGTNGIGKLTANGGVVIGDVNDIPPTLTKGTQGSTGFTVQELKDAGRTNLIFYANGVASGTTGTETAITLTKSAGTSATTTGTSFVITNGKTFRITSITFASRGNATATAQISTFNLRINTAGAVTTSSTPLVFGGATATAAVASDWDRLTLSFPDGVEYIGNGTIQFGLTANAVFVTNAPTWFVVITGYEY